MRVSVIIFVYFLLLLATTSYSQVKVFILSGQSNMVGYGKVNDLPTATKSEYTFKNVHLYTALNSESRLRYISPLKPGKTSLANSKMFGPELGIARQLTAKYPGETLVFVKIAVGGSGLMANWLNGGKSPYDPNVALYAWFLEYVNQARALIHSRFGSYVIKGMIWMQGESDGFQEDAASMYAENLALLVTKFRNDITPDLPFVYGMIKNGVHTDGTYAWPYGARVQSEQASAHYSIANSRCTDLTASTSATLWPAHGEGDFYFAHYNTKGILYVGMRLGDAMVDHLANMPKIACKTPHAGAQ